MTWMTEMTDQLRAMAGVVWDEINTNGLMPLLHPVAPFDKPSFLAPAFAIGGILGLMVTYGLALTALGGLLLSMLVAYVLLVDFFGFSLEMRPIGAR